jgi:hypothetical protein
MEITIPSDYKELLELLNSHNVEYIVVKEFRGVKEPLILTFIFPCPL